MWPQLKPKQPSLEEEIQIYTTELTHAQKLFYVLISFVTFQKSYYVKMIQRKIFSAKLNLLQFLERGNHLVHLVEFLLDAKHVQHA